MIGFSRVQLRLALGALRLRFNSGNRVAVALSTIAVSIVPRLHQHGLDLQSPIECVSEEPVNDEQQEQHARNENDA